MGARIGFFTEFCFFVLPPLRGRRLAGGRQRGGSLRFYAPYIGVTARCVVLREPTGSWYVLGAKLRLRHQFLVFVLPPLLSHCFVGDRRALAGSMDDPSQKKPKSKARRERKGSLVHYGRKVEIASSYSDPITAAAFSRRFAGGPPGITAL